MSNTQKTNTLYNHPFCKGYWRDAALELKDTKMLVFAALIVALRVALKSFVRIQLAPNLDITPAFLANALGAMVYGPVVGALGAMVSDLLGVMLRGDTYFLPYALTEISGTVIFAMFFYRQRVTSTRVILSRFSICLIVNVLMTIPIDNWYQEFTYGYHNTVLTMPRIFKNLFMFPIESAVLAVFLRAIQPVMYRMKLTYDKGAGLAFTARQIILLVTLVVVGIGSVVGYLFVHYDNTSLTTGWSTQERIDTNKQLHDYVLDECDEWDDLVIVTITDSAFKEFLSDEVTYDVSVYQVAEGVDVTDALWQLKKTPASKHEDLTKIGTASITVDEKTGTVLNFQNAPA